MSTSLRPRLDQARLFVKPVRHLLMLCCVGKPPDQAFERPGGDIAVIGFECAVNKRLGSGEVLRTQPMTCFGKPFRAYQI